MKNKLASLLLIPLLAGCALLSPDSTTTQKAADVQRLAALAASTGTQVAILQEPTRRPAFETALASLDIVVENKTVTGLVLRQILATLPISELESPEAKILILNATMLYDLAVGDLVNIEMQPYVYAAAVGIRNGMRDALTVTSPAYPPKK